MYYNIFTKYCISHGATITPLTTESGVSSHLGLCNPSVLDDNGTLRLIIRNVNFALWCCDNPYRFTSPYGPLCYMTKTYDKFLRTRNFLCAMNSNSLSYKMIDTSEHDYEPVFEMVGHEDMRLVRWDGKLYGTGVQRDYDEKGVGRMHLSELDPETGRELSRLRIKAPGDDNTYCEKNWMPVLDMPYNYVKWCNPFVLVSVDPSTGDSRVVLEKQVDQDMENLYFDQTDIRGSSQVVRWGDYRVAMVHRCRLWFNEKGQKSDTDYFTQFIVWDMDWNVVRISTPFKFAQFGIEFTNGLSFVDGKFIIPFALQDNMCFMMSVDGDVVRKFIFGEDYSLGDFRLEGSPFIEFFNDTSDSYRCEALGRVYYQDGHYASSFVCFQRACEYNTFRTRDELYECMYMCGMSLAKIGNMDEYEKSLWLRMVDLDPLRSEGYLMLSLYYAWRGQLRDAYTFARLAYMKGSYGFKDADTWRINGMIQYAKATYWTENYRESEEMARQILADGVSEYQEHEITRFLDEINANKEKRYRLL